jgi:hypothetical protein
MAVGWSVVVTAALRAVLLAGNEFRGINPQMLTVSVPNEWGLALAEYTASFELRKLEVHWSRTPSVGVVQDDDICTFHFLNLTAGSPDAPWIDADYAQVESAFDTFWTTAKTLYRSETKLSQYVWRADGPAYKPFGASLSPTLRATARSVAGTEASAGGSILPPQCAISVTEVTDAKFTAHGVGVPGDAPGTGRTQIRNRWGRFYLPAPSTIMLNDGRLQSGQITSIATAAQTFYNACVTAGNIPVMYSPTTGHAWSVTALHIDDIIDVIRSRRYVTPTTRTPVTINQP